MNVQDECASEARVQEYDNVCAHNYRRPFERSEEHILLVVFLSELNTTAPGIAGRDSAEPAHNLLHYRDDYMDAVEGGSAIRQP